MRVLSVTVSAVVVAVAAVLLAGCGSSSSSDSGTTAAATTGSEASSNPGVAAAQKIVEQYEGKQPTETLPKLGEVPAKGVNIDIVACPLPACQLANEGAVAGAKALGWNYKVITPELTPESYASRFSEIAAHPPEALVFLSAFPNETVETQLTELEEAGVPMAQMAPQKASEKPTKGIPSVLVSPPVFENGGKIAAAKMIAESEGSADAAVVLDPSFGTTVAAAAGWEAQFKENCPSCKAAQIDISLNSPATQNLSKVIAYLRQNPETKYVYFTIADMASGFPGALASAGLSEVKFITQTSEKTDLEQIANGEQWATIPNEGITVGYRAIDAVARQLQGESVGPEKYPIGWTALLTENNVPSEYPASEQPVPPGFPQNFYEAWGVEG